MLAFSRAEHIHSRKTQWFNLTVQRLLRSDIVYMTVYITDARYGDKFVEIRKEIFKQNFPPSTLVTVSGLAHPALLIEITTVAVIGSK
jgi:enamine deaminase RidA (YjgF/YER057c/UK114 family)